MWTFSNCDLLFNYFQSHFYFGTGCSIGMAEWNMNPIAHHRRWPCIYKTIWVIAMCSQDYKVFNDSVREPKCLGATEPGLSGSEAAHTQLWTHEMTNPLTNPFSTINCSRWSAAKRQGTSPSFLNISLTCFGERVVIKWRPGIGMGRR